MKIRLLAVANLMCFFSAMGAEIRPVTPPNAKVSGPYSPGIRAGEFLYVSGQGALNAVGEIPKDEDAQIRQCLKNVEAIVKTAGLTMEHIVYAQVYLTRYDNEETLNRVWREVFPKAYPARSVIGIAKLPGGTPVEINAVAIADLARKKSVIPSGYSSNVPVSPAIQAGDRLYVSGSLGRDSSSGRIPDDPAAQVQLALDHMSQTLKAAGLDFRHMVFINPFLTAKIPMNVMNRVYAKHFEFGNTPARATIQIAGLPDGANIQFTGVAVMDLSKRVAVRPKNMEPSPTASPCVFAGDTFFCSAKSGFIPGVNGGIYASTVETQLRQTMRNLLDGLEEAGMKFSNVVASHVYLDDVEDFGRMNSVYKQYFGSVPPARTTVQQIPPGQRQPNAEGRWPTLEQISIIAVK